MFKLVAFLFLITAPDDPPVHAMAFNQSLFPSEESCREFMSTDDGKAVAGSYRMMGAGNGLLVKFACIEAKDNTI